MHAKFETSQNTHRLQCAMRLHVSDAHHTFKLSRREENKLEKSKNRIQSVNFSSQLEADDVMNFSIACTMHVLRVIYAILICVFSSVTLYKICTAFTVQL